MGKASREKRERRKRREEIERYYVAPPPKNYPEQPLVSEGLTAAERDLAKLCRRTFLSLWSYPNVYRAEYHPSGGTVSKEVCDLLVVFGEDVIIFSDKDCMFPASGDIDKDWSRWYRRAVEKSAAQLYGAERVIRGREPLYLDPQLRIPFPLPLPDPVRMKVHRILVAHGVSARCREALGGNGTLMIQPRIVGDDHKKPRASGGAPFTIGQIDPTRGNIHVLDDASLVLLLRVLDTASDLIAYLTKKETFIASGRLAVAAGEEALLGWYQSELNAEGDHDFLPPDDSEVVLDEEWWHRFATGNQARRKLEADAVSYVWDRLIELFTKHFRQGTSDHLTEATPAAQAELLRFFARENRTRRRMLAAAIVEMLKTTSSTQRRLRVVAPSRMGDPYWVLLLLPFPSRVKYTEYREVRRSFLTACCQVVKLLNPDALDIVGFATEVGRAEIGSEDAAYLDARTWTPEMADEARRLQRELHILEAPQVIRDTVYEYPPEPEPAG